MPSDPNPKTRIRIAFLLLFIVFSVGAYFVSDLSKLQDGGAARDSRAALQGITSPAQIDEALAQHPQNKFLRLTAKPSGRRMKPARPLKSCPVKSSHRRFGGSAISARRAGMPSRRFAAI